MCLLPCLCTLAFYRLLLLVVRTVELLAEVAAADFTGNDHKSFGTQFTIQTLNEFIGVCLGYTEDIGNLFSVHK